MAEPEGNVWRVFCRVRPLLGDELLGNDGRICHLSFPDKDGKILVLENLSPHSEDSLTDSKGNNKYEFAFDRVFNPDSTQAQVFEEVRHTVQSALDGYNVCIFAYGQTGSGKTHTMEGPSEFSHKHAGMIPRAVGQIFDSIQDLVSKEWQYELEASFLKIYKERIRDLLGTDSDDVKHQIKKSEKSGSDDQKGVMVTNLTTVPVTSKEQVHELLRKASHTRSVLEVKYDERASRSQTVFQLRISGVNKNTQETRSGTLTLVDSGGSERVGASNSGGAQLKEALSIGRSCSALRTVFMAIANKARFIPYRESKLTHLLQNSLGGDMGKMVMLVHVSPKEECFEETLSSLRFATRVKKSGIGTTQKE
ncbi:carboxy-terminal kinesin 2-like [Saccostrea cucullata]|uniref:carboxy-terminal kinesin 2-like n=1 Tax=Saccostrea cuccullata TaxID=36930 RepID=UPI002ED591E2